MVLLPVLTTRASVTAVVGRVLERASPLLLLVVVTVMAVMVEGEWKEKKDQIRPRGFQQYGTPPSRWSPLPDLVLRLLRLLLVVARKWMRRGRET